VYFGSPWVLFEREFLILAQLVEVLEKQPSEWGRGVKDAAADSKRPLPNRGFFLEETLFPCDC